MSAPTYQNVHAAGLSDEASKAYEAALTDARAAAPFDAPHRIGGEVVAGGEWVERPDPACPARVASRHPEAGEQLVLRAVADARRAWPAWRRTPLEERIAILSRAGAAIAAREMELAALSSLETGKSRADALAEVQEAISLIRLYIEQVRRDEGYAVPQRPPDGGRADIVLKPLGVVGVIGPFNFPLAIPVTMSVAALIMGNAVVFKPSALTPACGFALASILEEAGLPAGVLNTVQGGGRVGALLSDADVDAIAFTGSADVGLEILARLGRPPYNRPLFAEMGGKSPAIVSASAGDVQVAARAVARSAFGMTGQKCNACSRAIVSAQIHDEFLAALAAEVDALAVGDPLDAGSFCGPLATAAAFDRFTATVADVTGAGARVVTGGGARAADGWYPELTVVADVPDGHRVLRDELFVPVLAVRRFDDFTGAIAEANDVRYGLSAGLFSDDRVEQDRFLDEIEAGITFLNNPGGATTGVWPGSQSMAGWKASASTGKGGFGPWYLGQFGREQSITRFGTAL